MAAWVASSLESRDIRATLVLPVVVFDEFRLRFTFGV
jgi:hypothetical protein